MPTRRPRTNTRKAFAWALQAGILRLSGGGRATPGEVLACTGVYPDEDHEYLCPARFTLEGQAYRWHHSSHHRRGTALTLAGAFWLVPEGQGGVRILGGFDVEASLQAMIRHLFRLHHPVSAS